MTTNFKEKPFRSAKYRAWVASVGCCVCGKNPAVAHHHQKKGTGVMGGKTGDDNCVPLCVYHHAEVHQQGRSIWLYWGVAPQSVAERLYAEYQGGITNGKSNNIS